MRARLLLHLVPSRSALEPNHLPIMQCHMRDWSSEDLGAGGDGFIKMSGPL